MSIDVRRSFPRLLLLLLPLLLPSLLPSHVVAATARSADPPAFRFGDYEATLDGLDQPSAVVIGDDSLLYIVETGADRVSVLTPRGERVRTIGSPGNGRGEMLMPRGIAVRNGKVYVTDSGNHRVQVFDLQGNFVRAFGSRGTQPWQLNEPHGIAVDDTHVYIADQGNRRVQIFDLKGMPFMTIGGGSSRGMQRPVDVVVDAVGDLYVTDADRNGVARFKENGQPLKQWGDWGPFLGLMDEPAGVVRFGDHVYVADRRNHRIQVYDPEGEHVEQWGVHAVAAHEGEGKLHYPDDLAIAPDGSFAVVCEGFENRCQVFRRNPSAVGNEMPIIPVRKMKAHFGERLGIDGKLLTLAEPENHRIYVFELSRDIPIVIGDFGDRGPRPGQMIRLAGLDVDVDGKRLWSTDVTTRRLQSFRLDYDPDGPRGYAKRRGRFARSLDLPWLRATLGLQLPYEIEPAAVRCHPDGTVYVLDSRNAVVIAFDAGMTEVLVFGEYGTGVAQLRRPTDLAFSRDGNTIFVVDSLNHRVQAFDRDGNFLRTFGSAGDGDGQFRRPFGITAGHDEYVYVTDESRHRVQRFKESGSFVAAWGDFGAEQPDLWRPKGIAQDERGRVYVVDFGNHRAQVYSPEGEWLVSFGTGRAYSKWDRSRGGGSP